MADVDAAAAERSLAEARDWRPYMEHAFYMARAAHEVSNHPFGAVLVDPQGIIVAKASNCVVTETDPTQHAELRLCSVASGMVEDPSALADHTLVTTCEPCVMCCGAIYWCGVRNVVYGAPHELLARLAGDSLLLGCRDVFRNCAAGTEVVSHGPILIKEAEDVLRLCWNGPKGASDASGAPAALANGHPSNGSAGPDSSGANGTSVSAPRSKRKVSKGGETRSSASRPVATRSATAGSASVSQTPRRSTRTGTRTSTRLQRQRKNGSTEDQRARGAQRMDLD